LSTKKQSNLPTTPTAEAQRTNCLHRHKHNIIIIIVYTLKGGPKSKPLLSIMIKSY